MIELPVEFLFDFGSPNAYLAHRLIPGLEARTGARVTYEPILLGGVFKLTGNASPAVTMAGIRNKWEYEQLEMRRFIDEHGLTAFTMNPHFPVNTLMLMRGAVFAAREGFGADYIETMFHFMWEDPRKLDDEDVFRAAAGERGLDGAAIVDATRDPQIKAELLRVTEAAVERGVFGLPSFFVGNELFFGKDRLAQVEREIERSVPTVSP